jgi:predicted ATPase/DNA-binding XRE family transcriptional regulator
VQRVSKSDTKSDGWTVIGFSVLRRVRYFCVVRLLDKSAMEARDSFGYWVRRRRKALDLTQEDLAQRVGCALITLRKIEADERRPSPQMANRLADCLVLPEVDRPRFLNAAVGRRTIAWLEASAISVTRLPGNLPAAMTLLIGREIELATVTTYLRRCDVRLLTVTGPFGVGKTRLALEAGRLTNNLYRDGVYLVELASVSDPASVPTAIAAIFSLRENCNRTLIQLVVDHLACKKILLILDNFEHLLPATPFLSTLLASCPNLQLLVTSRACLHLYGEHEFVLTPLDLPDSENMLDVAASPAVRLFCARARAARADFQLTPTLVPTVVQICCQLDGLPLAIELAAARVKLFSPQEILDRLQHRLSPVAQGADISLRLHVLESAIDWSLGLLSQTQRTLLLRLSVFAGSFNLAAAQAVCIIPLATSTSSEPNEALAQSDLMGDLCSLLDHSLLVREGSPASPFTNDRQDAKRATGSSTKGLFTQETMIADAGTRHCLSCPMQSLLEAADAESRFSMLKTIREFALERLAAANDLAALRQRHAEYFVAWAEEAAEQLNGPRQVLWLAYLERNIDNLRAALTWLLSGQKTALAARMVCALGMFWQRHGHYSEGRRWLGQVIELLPHHLVPDKLAARTLQTAAILAYRQGDWQVAQEWLTESLAIYRTCQDRLGAARVLFDFGWIAIDQANWDEALRLNQESLSLARAAGDPLATYRALTNIGWTHLCTGERETAAPFFSEAHTLAQQTGHTKGIAVSLANLGWVDLYRGDTDHAGALARQSLRLCCQLGEREMMAECLELLSIAAIQAGDARRAVMLSGGVEVLRQALHILRPATQHATVAHAAAVTVMRQQLSGEEFAAAWRAGRNLCVEAMLVFALGCGRVTSIQPPTSRSVTP